jgi:hypothetical protein
MKKNKIYIFLFNFLTLITYFFSQNAYANFIASGDTLSTSNYEIRRFDTSAQTTDPRDITFSNDGKKMFTVEQQTRSVFEYILSTPYNISTASFVQSLSVSGQSSKPFKVKFNNDGSKMFIAGRGERKVFEYSLSTNFDISSASVTYTGNFIDVSPQLTSFLNGLTFSPDGKIMIITEQAFGLHQYSLNKSFDLSGGANFIRSAAVTTLLNGSTHNGIVFNQSGTRLFMVDSQVNAVNQYTLSEGFNIATASFDGGARDTETDASSIDFSPSGLRMYVAGIDDLVKEYHLPCPFNLFAGKCTEITEGDRRGVAEAQVNIANRTIEHSTDTALNRLKWIRRNKDLQDLSFRNIKLNFSNQMLASLAEAIQVSTSPKEKSKNKDIFYWAEGSLAFGKVRETDTSSKKKIYTDGITIGADKFTDDREIKGLAFRYSQNDVKVGIDGSRLDTDTYNLTYYSTTPVKDDKRFLDAVVGIGALYSDISSVLDGNKLTGNRNGKQIYGTLKLKEEIKKDELTLIPAAQIDLGYTLLSGYSESGKTAMRFDKQSIQSRNLRLSIASVEELNNKKYKMKRHGKIEYQANLHRSSNIKYSYISDSSTKYDTELNSGALHNINGELGVDIIYDNNFSLFFIVEHNYKHRVGYTNKIHLAIGYLPQKNTNFAFKIEGDDILKSKYIYTKNVNGLDIDFYLLNNNAMRPETFDEIALNLRKVF